MLENIQLTELKCYSNVIVDAIFVVIIVIINIIIAVIGVGVNLMSYNISAFPQKRPYLCILTCHHVYCLTTKY